MNVKEIVEDAISNKLQLQFFWTDLIEADKILQDEYIHEPIVLADFSYPIGYTKLKTGALREVHRINFLVLYLLPEYDAGQGAKAAEVKEKLRPYVHRIFHQIRKHEEIRTKQNEFPTIGEAQLVSGNFSVHEIGWRFPVTIPFQPECTSGAGDLSGAEAPYDFIIL
jgi:hypothetical protein